MNRYQIYLNAQHVNTLDDLAHDLNISRSQIIRDVVSRVTLEYRKVFSVRASRQKTNNPLLRMAGLGHSKKTNISQNINEIYLRD